MKLSMWILADWLKKYQPETRIREGRRTLRNVRLFSDNIRMENMDVYMGPMKDFVDGDSNQVILVHGHDMILLKTEDINEVFNEILDAFDYYNAWSDRIREKIRTGSSLTEVLEDSYTVFGQKLLIADPGYLLIASYGLEETGGNPNLDYMLEHQIMPLDTILAINNDLRFRKYSSEAYLIDYKELGAPCLCRNLFSRNLHFGWVLVINDTIPPTRGKGQLLEELGDLVEMWSDYHSGRQNFRSYSDTFKDLLLHGPETVTLDPLVLSTLGWYPEDEKQLFLLYYKTESRLLLQLRHKLEALSGGCIPVFLDDRVVLIFNRRVGTYTEFISSLAELLRKTGACAAISQEFQDFCQMQSQYHLTEIILEYCPKLPGEIYDFQPYAVLYAAALIREHACTDISHPALYILKKYDQKQHTCLYQTLKTYLECEQNYVKTAEALYIHRNSLLYRLKRIRELTGLDLDDAKVRLHLLLSFCLQQN